MMKDHIQRLESGGHICMHCGGSVDEEGYSMDDPDIERGEADLSMDDDEAESPQYQATKRSFADAVSGRVR